MGRLTFSFFPNKAKQNRITKKTPVYIRIILDSKKAESRLNLELDKHEINYWHQGLMRVELKDCVANNHLDSISNEFRKFLALNEHNLTSLTVKEIRDVVLNRKQENQNPKTILDFINAYYENSVMNRQSITVGTKRNYVKAIIHFRAYLKTRKLTDLTFSKFEYKHAEGFKNYLLNDKPETGKIGMKETSAWGNVMKFKTMFDQAKETELIKFNHFKKIKLNHKSPRKPRLTASQLNSIYNLRENLTYLQALCRDLIVFSSMTGLAFQDTLKLSKKNLETKDSGEVKLVKSRIKTEEHIEQFLPSKAIALIKKYENHPKVRSTPFVFPKVLNCAYNLTLKIIAAKAEININLTTHIARHTFRQLLSEAGIQDSAVINRMMGKSSSDKIDNVYYEVTESRLLEAKQKFELYLATHLHEPILSIHPISRKQRRSSNFVSK